MKTQKQLVGTFGVLFLLVLGWGIVGQASELYIVDSSAGIIYYPNLDATSPEILDVTSAGFPQDICGLSPGGFATLSSTKRNIHVFQQWKDQAPSVIPLPDDLYPYSIGQAGSTGYALADNDSIFYFPHEAIIPAVTYTVGLSSPYAGDISCNLSGDILGIFGDYGSPTIVQWIAPDYVQTITRTIADTEISGSENKIAGLSNGKMAVLDAMGTSDVWIFDNIQDSSPERIYLQNVLQGFWPADIAGTNDGRLAVLGSDYSQQTNQYYVLVYDLTNPATAEKIISLPSGYYPYRISAGSLLDQQNTPTNTPTATETPTPGPVLPGQFYVLTQGDVIAFDDINDSAPEILDLSPYQQQDSIFKDISGYQNGYFALADGSLGQGFAFESVFDGFPDKFSLPGMYDNLHLDGTDDGRMVFLDTGRKKISIESLSEISSEDYYLNLAFDETPADIAWSGSGNAAIITHPTSETGQDRIDIYAISGIAGTITGTFEPEQTIYIDGLPNYQRRIDALQDGTILLLDPGEMVIQAYQPPYTSDPVTLGISHTIQHAYDLTVLPNGDIAVLGVVWSPVQAEMNYVLSFSSIYATSPTILEITSWTQTAFRIGANTFATAQDPTPTTTPTATPTPVHFPCSWEFETDGDLEGWTHSDMLSDVTVAAGSLYGVSTGNDPKFFSPNVSCNSEDYNVIEIRMMATRGTTGVLFYKTADDPTFTAAKRAMFALTANDAFVTYTLTTESLTEWSGTIDRFRFDPTEQSGADIFIDYIRLLNVEPTPTSTATVTHTETATETPTFLPSSTPSFTPTRTSTRTPTGTPTGTPTRTPTNTPVVLDLYISDYELVQVVQNTAKDVPLVAGKPTVFRAYVSLDAPLESQDGNVWGKLYYLKNKITYGPIYPMNNTTTEIQAVRVPKRHQYSHSLNFRLPKHATEAGVTRFWVELNPLLLGRGKPIRRIRENDYTNNRYPLIGTVFSTFHARTNYFRIGYYKVTYNPPSKASQSPTNGVHQGDDMLKRIFPIDPDVVDYRYLGDFTWTKDLEIRSEIPNFMAQLNMYWFLSELLRAIIGLEQYDQIHAWLPSQAVYYNGCSDPTWIGSMGRSAFSCETAGPLYYSSRWRRTFAHEIGHNFGRYHPNDDPSGQWRLAENDEVGFDVANDVLRYKYYNPDSEVNEMYRDIMWPARKEYEAWISPYTYRGLYDWEFIEPESARTRKLFLHENPTEAIVISGSVTVDGTGEIFPCYQVTSGVSPSSSTGEYSLELLDSTGKALVKHLFSPQFYDHDTSLDGEVEPGAGFGTFFEVLPFEQGTAQIVLKHNSDLLDRIPVSASTPTVTVLAPNGGEVLSGTFEIKWEGSDADPEDEGRLNYTVLYSSDNKESWMPINTLENKTSLLVNTASLAGGTECFFRVMVTDGVNTASDDSDAGATVEGKPPFAVIYSPSNDARYSTYEVIQIRGQGQDVDDGLLGEVAHVWSSDKDGKIGTGTLVETISLTPGTHKISLTVSDSDGNSVTESVTITIDESVRILGDIHRDGHVNTLDLLQIAEHWQRSATGEGWNPSADIDEDGQISEQDVLILIRNMEENLTQENSAPALLKH